MFDVMSESDSFFWDHILSKDFIVIITKVNVISFL